MEDIKKRKHEIEQQLAELKGRQAAELQKKKSERDLDALDAARDQINTLKEEVSQLYRPKKAAAETAEGEE